MEESIDEQRDGLKRSLGDEEGEVMWASVGVMLHGLVIQDWRRVYKGLWCIHETIRRLTHDSLPDYFYEKPDTAEPTEGRRK